MCRLPCQQAKREWAGARPPAVFFLGPARWDRSGVSSWLRGENGNELHGLASDLALEPWAEGLLGAANGA